MQNSQENIFVGVSFLIELHAWVLYLNQKRDFNTHFPVNFVRFLRILYLTEHLPATASFFFPFYMDIIIQHSRGCRATTSRQFIYNETQPLYNGYKQTLSLDLCHDKIKNEKIFFCRENAMGLWIWYVSCNLRFIYNGITM